MGQDEGLDLAVLKLEGREKFDSVTLNPEAVRSLAPGKTVAVLGRSEPPGGLTVNSGVVSAVGRYTNTCAQVSALINYGNLGGPAVDLKGEVIGIAVHLTDKTSWRQNCGVGFVLQADKIVQALPDLKAGKKLPKPARPYLGVRSDMGALDVKGARINRVEPGSPAEDAGMKAGDVIVHLDGRPVGDWLQLQEAIKGLQIGQIAPIKVKRGDKELLLKIKIGQRE
jgi:S1-C subfamily serine protease